MRVKGISRADGQPTGNEGWIYVLSNKSMPGMLKIGLTTRDPQQRARELSGSTGVPTPFVVAHSRYVSDCRAVERGIHQQLDRYRVGKNREFFQMTVADATRAVDSAAMKYDLGGAKKSGGCVGGVGRFFANLFLWPFYLLGWMWRRGNWGKAGAVVSVLMVFGLLTQPPEDGSLGVVPTDEAGVSATAFPVVLAEASPTWTATATETAIVVRLVDVPTATTSSVATDVVATSTATATDLATATSTVMAVAVEAATIAPTNTATAAPTATTRSTNTATPAPTNTTAPTATPRPTNTPLPTSTIAPAAVANRDANLRAGPGTEFAVAGNAQAGDALRVVGRNAAGDWYELEGGRWIAAFLVDGAPDVAVAAVIPTAPPTAVPVVVAPTATAVVVQAPAAPVATAAPNPQAFECVGGCAVPPDPSCAIKGNVNSSGERIYHVPGGQFYDRTDIKPEEGDRWFCTSAEAQAAGFRASQR